MALCQQQGCRLVIFEYYYNCTVVKGNESQRQVAFHYPEKAAILKQDFLSGTLTSTDHKGQSLTVYSSFQNSLYIYIRETNVWIYIGLWTPAAVYCFLLSFSGCKNIQTDRSLFVPTQQPGSLMLEPSVHSLCWFMNEYIRFWDNFFFFFFK